MICPLKTRIKTYNALKLLFNLAEQNEHPAIQVQALSTLRMTIEKEMLENSVIFHKANGYKYLENAISDIVSAAMDSAANSRKLQKLPLLRQVLDLAGFVTFVLGDLDALPMVEFLSALVLNYKQLISNEIYEEITNYIN